MLMIRPPLAWSIGRVTAFGRVEGAEQVRLEHVAPVVDAHAHDQVVARDAGVVDQDVDLAEGVERGLDRAPRPPPAASRRPGRRAHLRPERLDLGCVASAAVLVAAVGKRRRRPGSRAGARWPCRFRATRR